jgi:hypothetical protein
MLRSTTLPLIAAAALMLATAGCSLEKVDRGQAVMPSTGAIAEPAAGHELHMMFEAEKRNAAIGELPAQF